MTLNEYMVLQKRSQTITNGLMLLLGSAITVIIALLFFMNQQPAGAVQADTAQHEDGSYAVYAAAYADGFAAANGKGATATQVTHACAQEDAAAPTGGMGAGMMSPEQWKTAVHNSYNTYNNTAHSVTNTDSFNATTTNNTSASTVNVTNSNGANVSSNSATNGQVESSTGVINLGSNNTNDSFNQETTNTTVTTNTDTDITTTLVNNSYNDESIRTDVDLSLVETTVRS